LSGAVFPLKTAPVSIYNVFRGKLLPCNGKGMGNLNNADNSTLIERLLPSYKMRRSLQFFTLIIPALVIFTVGLIIPMFMALDISFTSWNGFTAERPFVGLENYTRLINDRDVRNAWSFTIRFTIWNTIIQNVFALTFALALDSAIKFKKIFRTIFFIPCLISPLIVGFVWTRIFGNVLPALMNTLGLDINLMLLGHPDTVLSGLLTANNWQWIGYWMMIYLAALQSIPTGLYEAARVDGANKIRRFFHITIPMLAPAFTICIVGITIGSLRLYDLLIASTGGGPGRSSTSIILHTFNAAIGGRQYAYGMALTMSLIFVLLIVAVVQVLILKRREVQL
jgi:ABC-type sugar transport system permease subunit